jgi:hypothetical protein
LPYTSHIRVLLSNIPRDATLSQITGLIWGGRILNAKLNRQDGTCKVRFVNKESCEAYLRATNGNIPWPLNHSRYIKIVRRDKLDRLNSIHAHLSVFGSGHTVSRVVQVFQLPNDVTEFGMFSIARIRREHPGEFREVEYAEMKKYESDEKDNRGNPKLDQYGKAIQIPYKAFQVRFMSIRDGIDYMMDVKYEFQEFDRTKNAIYATFGVDPCHESDGVHWTEEEWNA